MKLRLVRGVCAEGYTEGQLYIDSVWFCFTLEDQDRKLECGGEKVHGQTCVPRGAYKVVIDFSNRFQQLMPRLVDVPGFTGIRIHAGNVAADTDGCVLVGTARADGRVMNSRMAYHRLMILLEDALDRGEAIDMAIE